MIVVQLAAAFLVAWFYYMIAMAMTVYDGPLSIIFQSMVGALFAGGAVLICLMLGLPIRLVAKLREAWQHVWWLPFFLGAAGFTLMVTSWQSPFRQTVHDHATGMDVQSFQPALALVGWLLSIFAALHFRFPISKLRRKERSDGRTKPA